MFNPWDRGEAPVFVNPEGFEWYPDASVQNYLRMRGRDDEYHAFLVRKGGDVNRVIVRIHDREPVWDGKSLVDAGAYVDRLWLQGTAIGGTKK